MHVQVAKLACVSPLLVRVQQNLITGLGDALMDSIPVVAITGQVASPLIGTDAFQEADVLGLSLACTKHSFLVQSIEELPDVIAKAFEIAASGRPGPVLIDIPKASKLPQPMSRRSPILWQNPPHFHKRI
ncbi:acetolactate synthase 2 catalytic subunit, partial [Pasteurella multocida subsp. multocida str. Anand1_cattle]